ncbi:DUF6054 family protein [uncultured Faecalibacterium sp.]|uniref:DUF6054 family protein n=1 Tax=uncultured Faecalibacterium sp. TaxID=259315 RepID=UPI002805BA9B|nr:DUF6054 family protein [uncultured Faecalibacterium sp.]
MEAGSNFKEDDARCSVRVFERYSMMGGDFLILTMFQNDLATCNLQWSTFEL